jgi:O2-independent ubiquinone biosynthesis protein UbiV
MTMRLALGPIAYHWPRDTVFAFYRAVAKAPYDIVYLGETVCSRRRELVLDDWLDIALMLTLAGKHPVLSTLPLAESAADVAMMRKIAATDYRVEANNLGVVDLLGHRKFVAGANLNIYNAATLALVARLGAVRWVAPIEISRSALETMQRARPAALETEVYAYGRLPLAYSHDCFTARRFKLKNENCAFRCGDFPEGLPARTRELKPFLVLNGKQTQSASVCNLIREIPRIADLGVDVVRIAATYAHVTEIAELFRQAIDDAHGVESAALELERITHVTTCDGYWHGAPGMQLASVDVNQSSTLPDRA